MTITRERPEDERFGGSAARVLAEALVRLQPSLPTRRFSVTGCTARMVGSMVIADLTFADGTTVTIRMAPGRARLLADRVYQAFQIDRRLGKKSA